MGNVTNTKTSSIHIKYTNYIAFNFCVYILTSSIHKFINFQLSISEFFKLAQQVCCLSLAVRLHRGLCGKFYYVFRFINIEQIIELQIVIIIVIYCIHMYVCNC